MLQAPGLSPLCHLQSNHDLSKWDFASIWPWHFQQTTESTAKASLRGSSTTTFWIFRREKHRFLFKRLVQSHTAGGQLPVFWLLQQAFHQHWFPSEDKEDILLKKYIWHAGGWQVIHQNHSQEGPFSALHLVQKEIYFNCKMCLKYK